MSELIETDSRSHWVIEGTAETWLDHEGRLCVAQVNADDLYPLGLYVRLGSWNDEALDHPNAHLHGRRVRVEITILPDSDQTPAEEPAGTLDA